MASLPFICGMAQHRILDPKQGVSLEAQQAEICAMVTARGADLGGVIVDGRESAEDLDPRGVQRLLGLVNSGKSIPSSSPSSID